VEWEVESRELLEFQSRVLFRVSLVASNKIWEIGRAVWARRRWNTVVELSQS